MVYSCSIDLQDKEEDRRSFRPRIEDGVQAVHRYPWCPAADQRRVLGQQSAGVPTGQSRHYQPHHSTHWSVLCLLSVRMMTAKNIVTILSVCFLVLCTFILACSVKRCTDWTKPSLSTTSFDTLVSCMFVVCKGDDCKKHCHNIVSLFPYSVYFYPCLFSQEGTNRTKPSLSTTSFDTLVSRMCAVCKDDDCKKHCRNIVSLFPCSVYFYPCLFSQEVYRLDKEFSFFIDVLLLLCLPWFFTCSYYFHVISIISSRPPRWPSS